MTTRPTPDLPAAVVCWLLLVAALDARLLQQLAVLLLGHPLAALLDDGTHVVDLFRLGRDESARLPTARAQRDAST
jgi:hypothetical protein